MIICVVLCIMLFGISIKSYAYSTYFSLTPIGFGDWKATSEVYKANASTSYASVSAVQGGGTLASYIANRYIAQYSAAKDIKTGYNLSYALYGTTFDNYYKYVVQSQYLDPYGRNTYGTWQP